MLFICAKSSSFWLRVEKTFQTLDWELQSKWPRKPFERNFWMLKIYNHVVLLLYQVVPQRCICLGDSRRNVTALQLDIWMLCLSWYLQNLKAGFWFFSEFFRAHNSWHICEFGSNKRLKVKVHLCNFCNHQTNNLPPLQFLTTKRQSPSLSSWVGKCCGWMSGLDEEWLIFKENISLEVKYENHTIQVRRSLILV